jgi:TP901-1 family phage major tail protein
MSAESGRDFTIEKDGTVLAGLRENSIAFDGSPVEITSKDDGGFRTLASFAGAKSFDISATGVLKDSVLQDLALTPGSSLLLTDVTIVMPDETVIAGDVYLASATFAGAHDGEVTYDVSLQSSGPWTLT